jgi:hypothetical protein
LIVSLALLILLISVQLSFSIQVSAPMPFGVWIIWIDDIVIFDLAAFPEDKGTKDSNGRDSHQEIL